MPINAKHLLRLAAELASSPAEVKRRAAISRAYYASYHRCRNWEDELPERGDGKQLKGSHESLISRLRHPHPSCASAIADCSRYIGNQLELQRQNRVHADYKVDKWVPRLMLEEQLQLAADVVAVCDESDPSHGRRRCRRRPP